MTEKDDFMENTPNIASSGLTQFIGTAAGDTIGLVIANVDPSLHERMGIGRQYRSIGIIGARTGAGAQIMAVDEAVKGTNTEVLSIELPRDTKSGGGHGNLILIGAKDVTDARQAVETALRLTDVNAGELYISDAGHMEFQFTARAGEAFHMAFGAPLDRAFGFLCVCPAAIGLVVADIALKSAGVEIVSYGTPTRNTSHSNEVVTTITGEAEAVKQAVLAARSAAMQLLCKMGPAPVSPGIPYLD